MHRPEWTAAFAEDLRAATGAAHVGAGRALWLLLTRPGVLATALLRVQQAVPGRAKHLVRGLAHALTGADFVPGCRVGPGLRLEHPGGLVVGAGAVLGRDVFLCQRVTLGERLGDREPGYPVLGDGVFVGAGATVLGAVRIGAGARIGAHSLVLRDVPARTTAVGTPARAVRAHASSTRL